MEKKRINILAEEFVREMFRGTNESLLNEDTMPVTLAKQDLSNEFERHYNSGNKAKVAKQAKNYGVNLDRGAQRNAERNKMLGGLNPETDVIPKGSYEKAVGSMSNDLRDALKDMNRVKELGKQIADIAARAEKDPAVDTSILPQLKAEKDRLNNKWGGFAGFQRYKDIADKFSLTPAYDQERAKEAGINTAPFNTSYQAVNSDGEEYSTVKKPMGKPEKVTKKGITPAVPADKVIGYNFDNLDLTSVPDSEIIKYFKTGTRKDHKYDELTGEKTNPNKGKTYSEMAQLASLAEKGDKKGKRALADLRNLYFKAMFNKLLNSKFGYDFKMPTSMYTYGNAKLPDDTLVVNFTSAHRCPAWSECLVGYACYARGSEHNYEGLHKKNTNLNLMWSSAEHDDRLLQAMFNVIRMHLINPGNIATALLNNPNTQQKWYKILSEKDIQFSPLSNKTIKPNPQNLLAMPGKNDADEEEMAAESRTLLGNTLNEVMGEAGRRRYAPGEPRPLKRPTGARDNLAGMIYQNKFADIFDEQDLEVVKNTKNAFRAKFIRLNEEGDFIGQWLLKAFDDFAGDLKLVGISTAAYTCRNLNFDNIKNIIINASTLDVGTSHDKESGLSKKDVSNAIARRFFAVSPELYDSLEDTYVPTGRKLDYQIPPDTKKGDYDGSKPLIPLHKTGDGLHVKYDLKAYTDFDDTTNPKTFMDAHDPNGATVKRRLYYKCPCGRHGDVLDEKGKPIKMNCYLCRMCYEPKDQNAGEIYVLVEVHGDNTDSFDMNKANDARGISNKMKTFKEAKNIFANRLIREHKEAEQAGIEAIANNIYNSAVEHMSEIGNKALALQNQIQTEGKKFSNMVKLIEALDKKRYNDIID